MEVECSAKPFLSLGTETHFGFFFMREKFVCHLGKSLSRSSHKVGDWQKNVSPGEVGFRLTDLAEREQLPQLLGTPASASKRFHHF